ncbi:MAG TPA: 4-phosphoerythronate dehydrogenase PdxB [Lentisphaeria bacterium]|nr:MAG: erythronate-4-phosphate dehydrogenase [Lentisphaerae bacterium GWF2_50_93]HCE44626.1 4-phosphoerythronate dehydrogenase PdxB [Lentisphaeria bacterium]
MKIVADNKIPFLKGVLEPYAEVVYLPGAKIAKADLADADGLIVRTRTKCNKALLEGSKVKFVATATIGFDHIDTNYCESNGIFWTNAAGCNSASVAQYVASAILNIAVENKFSLSDKTLGIIGVGNVGSKVAKFAKTVGMKVLLNDPPRARKEGEASFVSLEQIKAEADIITMHVPLSMAGSDKTYHLADKIFFNSIAKRAWFINSSRGEVADTEGLKNILKTSMIAGAILDVWENEPEIDLELLGLAKFATPHIAGYSTDGKANGTSMSVEALAKFFGLKQLDGWYPKDVPKPENTTIKIDCKGKSKEQILLEAVKFTYDVRGDDQRLRSSPKTFEKQREEYPLRREFKIFKIIPGGIPDEVIKILHDLGFETTVNE